MACPSAPVRPRGGASQASVSRSALTVGEDRAAAGEAALVEPAGLVVEVDPVLALVEGPLAGAGPGAAAAAVQRIHPALAELLDPRLKHIPLGFLLPQHGLQLALPRLRLLQRVGVPALRRAAAALRLRDLRAGLLDRPLRCGELSGQLGAAGI